MLGLAVSADGLYPDIVSDIVDNLLVLTQGRGTGQLAL